jgi:hypothetical protein
MDCIVLFGLSCCLTSSPLRGQIADNRATCHRSCSMLYQYKDRSNAQNGSNRPTC